MFGRTAFGITVVGVLAAHLLARAPNVSGGIVESILAEAAGRNAPSKASSGAGDRTRKTHVSRHDCNDVDCETCDGETSFWLYVGEELVWPVVASPVWVPMAVLEDEHDHVTRFVDYPYQEPDCGCLYRDPANAASWSLEQALWGRASIDFATPVDDLYRVGGSLFLSGANRFGVDAQAHWFEERLGDGSYDHMTLGDADIHYRFAESERGYFYIGVGFNWLEGEGQFDAGVNTTYGFDLFFARPFVSSTQIDLGTLGDTSLFRFRTTIGAAAGRFEPFIGYEYLDVGTTELNQLVSGITFSF
ncbi:hypothetical protein JCM19992_35300 [Thermostilla marina]